MSPDLAIEIGRGALMTTITVSAPILLAALATGLLVGLFQAATQIQEQTLSFIPKLLAMVVVLIVGGPFILGTMLDYFRELITEIMPRAIGA